MHSSVSAKNLENRKDGGPTQRCPHTGFSPQLCALRIKLPSPVGSQHVAQLRSYDLRAVFLRIQWLKPAISCIASNCLGKVRY